MYFHQGNYLGGSEADDDLEFRFGSSPQASTPWPRMEPKIVPITTTIFGGLSGPTGFLPCPNIKSFPGCCCANRTCSCTIGGKGIYRYNEAVTGCLKSPVAQGIRSELER
jgi:hypothetical protein